MQRNAKKKSFIKNLKVSRRYKEEKTFFLLKRNPKGKHAVYTVQQRCSIKRGIRTNVF